MLDRHEFRLVRTILSNGLPVAVIEHRPPGGVPTEKWERAGWQPWATERDGLMMMQLRLNAIMEGRES